MEYMLFVEKTLKTQVPSSYFMEFAFIILTRTKCHKGHYTVHDTFAPGKISHLPYHDDAFPIHGDISPIHDDVFSTMVTSSQSW